MRNMLGNSIGRLRFIALLEGVSFILLLGIAMPLKYLANMEFAVKICGSVHGGLFIVFCVALFAAASAASWSLLRTLLIFGSSLIPFGPFLIDPSLRRDEQQLLESQSASSAELTE
ncbi:MAG: integral membrane protein [Pirellulaceae bacterium]|jgi:integral membrane protein